MLRKRTNARRQYFAIFQMSKNEEMKINIQKSTIVIEFGEKTFLSFYEMLYILEFYVSNDSNEPRNNTKISLKLSTITARMKLIMKLRNKVLFALRLCSFRCFQLCFAPSFFAFFVYFLLILFTTLCPNGS